MEYWEEQQLKQTGYFEEEPKATAPDPKFGEPALEKSLENVKKTLWDVERHTSDTQSRLDKNNQSGPSHPLYKIAKWSDNKWILDMISETLVELQDTLETSSIARHSASPLEESLKAIHDQAVYYNEKTLRWHDSQTNRFSPGQSSLNEAAEANLAQPTEKSNYLKEIAENTKEALERIPFKEESAEDKMESEARQANRDRDLKAYRKTMKGRWDSFLKWSKESWFVKNWKLVAVGLALLFTPFKYLKPLWKTLVAFWKMPFWGKLLALATAWFAWTKLKGALGKAGQFLKKSIATRGVAGTAGHMVGKTKKAAKAVGSKVVSGAKATGKATTTAATTAATKTATTAATKTATKGAGKAVSKGLGKSLLKKIPGVGLLFGAGFAVSKALAGDFTGAGMELASGAMSIVPGVGTAGSVAMDAAIMARDMGAMKDKEKAGKELGETLNKEYKEGKKDGKAVKVTTTHKKGITPMGPMESIKVHATSGEVTPRMSKLSATKRLEKMRKRSEGESGMSGREEKRIRKLLVGEDHVPKKSILDKRKKQKGSKWEGWDASGGHHSAVEMWKQMTDEERKKFARYKPKGADDKATVIPTPPRGDFKTKIPQVGVPEKKEPTEGEPSKWLPFGHDKSAFKKQTSFGDRFKNLAKFLWGDKKADEKKGAEPVTSEDQKSVDMAVARWLKRRKVKGKKNLADRGMKTYIKGIITDKNTAKLELLEKELKSLGGRWLKRSGLEAAKDSYVEAEGVTGLRKKGMGADSSIARAWSGEEGAMEVAKERFPGIKFTAREQPEGKMNVMNNVHADRATLGDNQASPTIIASETTNFRNESNPLTYVSGASSARGKPIRTSRGN